MPLWCEIERSDTSILSMNDKYDELIEMLDRCIAKVEDFVAGELLLSFADSSKLENDIEYQALMKSSPYDGKVCILLQIILPSVSKAIKH